MSRKTLTLTPGLQEYLLRVSLREPRLLRRLREETAKLDVANMQISPEQGQFMSLLVELTAARNIIEVGLYRLQRTLHGDGHARRRTVDMLRCQRRMDVHRPPLLGRGGN